MSDIILEFNEDSFVTTGLVKDANGKFKSYASKEIETTDFNENYRDTFFSLCSGHETFWSQGLKTLTPKALLFLARLNAKAQVKGKDFSVKFLRETYDEISSNLVKLLSAKRGEKEAKEILNMLEFSWNQIMISEDKLEFIFNLYDEILLPSIESWEKVISVPLFDTYIIKNCLDYTRFLTNYKDKGLEKDLKSAQEELKKIQNKAHSYLSGNSLNKFMDQNVFNADFNVLMPFTHIPGGVWELHSGLRIDRDNGIFVPPLSGFKVGDRVAILRHPSSTGVEILTVVGHTKDHTIKISEIFFRKFLADADGDFVLISEVLTWLITGHKNK